MASEGKLRKRLSVCLSQVKGSVSPAEDAAAKKSNSECLVLAVCQGIPCLPYNS